jgi:hypothetical protein
MTLLGPTLEFTRSNDTSTGMMRPPVNDQRVESVIKALRVCRSVGAKFIKTSQHRQRACDVSKVTFIEEWLYLRLV